MSHHNKSQNQSDKIKQLREDWKKIGPISRAQNDTSWSRFIGAIKLFNTKKNDFYKDLKKNQKDNLAIKQEIVEKAESLSDSTDWRETANLLKKLQADWKKSGMASKKESDALWKRLKKACTTFFDNLKKQEVSPGFSVQSDSEISNWLRANAWTEYHPCSTCRMGIDDNSVTNKEGLVYETEGLRVVDASIMPFNVPANLNAPVLMIAEKIADTIKKKI